MKNLTKLVIALLIIPAVMIQTCGCENKEAAAMKSENSRLEASIKNKDEEIKLLNSKIEELDKKYKALNEENGRLARMLTDAGLSTNPDETKFNDCKENLKKIAIGLKLYAADNGNKYPKKLSEISTNDKYLDFVPTCPSASKDTYSNGYKPSKDLKSYSVCCSGCNHDAILVKENNPAYDSERGMIVERDKEKKVKDEFDEAAKDDKDEKKDAPKKEEAKK